MRATNPNNIEVIDPETVEYENEVRSHNGKGMRY